MVDYKVYIHAVAMERSFSRAAEKLFVSQPWLSAAVKRVEQELGCQLFDRSTNPISLTSEGRYYIAKTDEIMTIEREMEMYFAQLRDGGGTLRIGSSMFFCTYVLPVLMSEFREMYPQITVSFSEGNKSMLSEGLISGALDVVLEAEPMANSRIKNAEWAPDELVLAVPAELEVNARLGKFRYSFDEFVNRHKGARRPPVPLDAFASEEFIMLKEGNDSYVRGMQMCKNAGFTPKVSFYLTQMMTEYYLVCEGRGVAFLRSAIPDHVMPVKSVVFYKLKDPLAMRNIYLSWAKRETTPARRRLIDFLLDESVRRAGR